MKKLLSLLLAVILILPACTTQKGGENMANMLYNGVELPDINTVWTDELKAQYPYAYLSVNDASSIAGESGAIMANLFLYSTKPIAKPSDTTAGLIVLSEKDWKVSRLTNNQTIKTTYEGIGYDVGLNEWGGVSGSDDTLNTANANGWANFDILNEDGSVFLAASEPVPVSKLTIATGSANGDGMALYNGVMLPQLPVRDGFPYASFSENAFGEIRGSELGFDEDFLVGHFFNAYLSSVSPTYRGASSYYAGIKGPSEYVYITLIYDITTEGKQALLEAGYTEEQISMIDGAWDLGTPVSLSADEMLACYPEGEDDIVWCNADVISENDGTVYLAASDPIALDGMNVITWDGDTTGLYNPTGGLYKVADYIEKPTVAYSVYWSELTGFTVASNVGVNSQFGSDGWYLVSVSSTISTASVSADNPGGFDSGLYFSKGTNARTTLFAYKPTTSSGVTETTATVNFSCKDLTSTDKVYHIKAWCYPKGMDYWTAPATWESELFAGTTHSESVTFTNLLPGTEYEVYAVIYGIEGATEHNATANFTTLGSAEGTVNAVILCNQVTETSFTAWLFAQGLDSSTEYTAEFVVYRNDASGVFEDVLTFTGSENIQYSEFKGLRPNTEYIASVYLYPTGGEVIYFGECPVTTLEADIPDVTDARLEVTSVSVGETYANFALAYYNLPYLDDGTAAIYDIVGALNDGTSITMGGRQSSGNGTVNATTAAELTLGTEYTATFEVYYNNIPTGIIATETFTTKGGTSESKTFEPHSWTMGYLVGKELRKLLTP